MAHQAVELVKKIQGADSPNWRNQTKVDSLDLLLSFYTIFLKPLLYQDNLSFSLLSCGKNGKCKKCSFTFVFGSEWLVCVIQTVWEATVWNKGHQAVLNLGHHECMTACWSCWSRPAEPHMQMTSIHSCLQDQCLNCKAYVCEYDIHIPAPGVRTMLLHFEESRRLLHLLLLFPF